MKGGGLMRRAGLKPGNSKLHLKGAPMVSPAYTFGYKHTAEELSKAVQHKHFNSPREFATFLKTHENKSRFGGYYSNDVTKGLDYLANGDASLVDEARKQMNKLQAKLPTLAKRWTHEVAGFFPDIPAYLAGDPEHMWHQITEQDDYTPVRIFVNVLPSGGVGASQLLARGAILVALAMLLQERRSTVRITPYCDQPSYSGKGVVVSYDLPTSPINLSQLCAALGQPAVVRSLSMQAAGIVDPQITGGWLRGHCPGYAYSEAQCRADLNAGPDDIIIPALFLGDDMINKPTEWLTRELSRILGEANVE